MILVKDYVFPWNIKLHPSPSLVYLTSDKVYGYSGKRNLQIGAKIVFAYPPTKSFVGEIVTTSSTRPSSIPRWKREVAYDHNAIFRYNPAISYNSFGKNVGVYPSIDTSYYNGMIKRTSKIKV